MHPSIIWFKAPLFTYSFLIGKTDICFLHVSPAFLNHVSVIFDRISVAKSPRKKTSLGDNGVVLVTVEFCMYYVAG